MPDALPLPKFDAEVERTLDNGLRLVVPPDWREFGIPEFFLVRDSNSSFIKAFPPAEYDKIIEQIEKDCGSDLERLHEEMEAIGSVSKRVKLDAAGRLAVPSELCEAIGIGTKSPKVLLKGAVRTFNIWNPAKYADREAARKKMEASGQQQVNGRRRLGV
jgi:DNA-binding transcriptional regulator/RsmH inhibitor MraZ